MKEERIDRSYRKGTRSLLVAVLGYVMLAGFFCMACGVGKVPVGDVRMMRRLFVVAFFMVISSFIMMFCCIFVVLGGFPVMLGGLFGHWQFSSVTFLDVRPIQSYKRVVTA